MTYLEDATADLRDARDANRRLLELTAHLDDNHPYRIRLCAERLRIAEDLLAAAAIEAGLPPAYPAARPGQETP